MKKSRLFSVLLTLVFLVSGISASSVSAAKPVVASGQTKTITISGKKIKVDSTVSAKELSYLTSDIMSDYVPEGTLVSVSQTITPMGSVASKPTTSNMLQPLTISADSMTVTATCERIVDKGSSYDEFKFTSWATWSGDPFWHFSDKLALSWSGDFSLYSSTCACWTSTNVPFYGTQTDVSPSSGVAFSFPVEYNSNLDWDYTKKVKLIAYVYNTNATGTANLVAKYGHSLLVVGASVSFPLGGSISFGIGVDSSIPGSTAWTY